MTCEWCGHEHARDALCTSRPKWSRRGFLALFGAGVAGLAVAPSLPVLLPGDALPLMHVESGPTLSLSSRTLDAILKEIYQPVIERQLTEQRQLWRVMKGDLKKGQTLRVHVG